MRICFVADSHPSLPQYGGIAVFTQRAAQALSQRGHEVHILVCAHGLVHNDLEDSGVKVHIRSTRWLPLIGGLLPGVGESVCCAAWLYQLQRLHSFDIVEFPNWQGMGLVPLLFRVVRGVVRLHTSTADSLHASARKAGPSTRLLIRCENASCRLAEGIVTHSQAQLRSFIRSGGRQNVTVIPHGIPVPAHVTSERSNAVLCIGGLGPRKGGGTLLQAIPLILSRHSAEFWIVGADPKHPLAKKFIAEHPSLAPRVHFLGFIAPDELTRRYAECAVYASASIYESFGLTFVEAMALEKPCVGCAAGAIPEIIVDETSGLLVPPADSGAFAEAINRLLDDSDLRHRMGRKGRELVIEKFSIEKMTDKIECFFSEFVNKR